VSPILSNIYLHQLDKYIERLIEEKSSKKKNISKVNSKIVKYSTKLTELNKEYQDTKNKEKLKEIRNLRQERNKLPSRIRTDIRISYVRYADD